MSHNLSIFQEITQMVNTIEALVKVLLVHPKWKRSVSLPKRLRRKGKLRISSVVYEKQVLSTSFNFSKAIAIDVRVVDGWEKRIV